VITRAAGRPSSWARPTSSSADDHERDAPSLFPRPWLGLPRDCPGPRRRRDGRGRRGRAPGHPDHPPHGEGRAGHAGSPGTLYEIPRENDRAYSVASDQLDQNYFLIRASDKQSFPILLPTGNIRYALDRTYVKAVVVGLVGWVGNLDTMEPPQTMVVTLTGKSIYVGKPNVERSGVAAQYGPSLLWSGYGLEMQLDQFRQALKTDPELQSLNLFARFSDDSFINLELQESRKMELARMIRAASVAAK